MHRGMEVCSSTFLLSRRLACPIHWQNGFCVRRRHDDQLREELLPRGTSRANCCPGSSRAPPQIEFEHKVVSNEETSAVSSTSSLTSRLSFQLQETARRLADPISSPMLGVSGSLSPPTPCFAFLWLPSFGLLPELAREACPPIPAKTFHLHQRTEIER